MAWLNVFLWLCISGVIWLGNPKNDKKRVAVDLSHWTAFKGWEYWHYAEKISHSAFVCTLYKGGAQQGKLDFTRKPGVVLLKQTKVKGIRGKHILLLIKNCLVITHTYACIHTHLHQSTNFQYWMDRQKLRSSTGLQYDRRRGMLSAVTWEICSQLKISELFLPLIVLFFLRGEIACQQFPNHSHLNFFLYLYVCLYVCMGWVLIRATSQRLRVVTLGSYSLCEAD